MQRNQWTQACKQLLKHWGRSGIQQVPLSTSQSLALAEDWLEVNAPNLFDGDLSGHDSTSNVGLELQRVDLGMQKPEVAVASESLSKKTSSVMPAAVKSNSPSVVSRGDGKWMSRSLPVEERQLAFQSLNDQVTACRKCEDIVCRRQQTVFGVGAIHARVVMFGEAPGAEEDRLGEPFVGPAGQLLDKILVASGLKRPEVYIVNALKCRPTNNRTPTDVEIENCRPFFEAQLETIQPEYIVCWGAVAVRAVLGSTDSVGRLRGKFHDYRGAKVLVTYHPAYLLRTPDAKKLTWEDMKMLMKDMGLPIPGKN